MEFYDVVFLYLDWILLFIGGAAAFWLVWVKGW
ncbi:Uncharacterised protein [Yersinia frederiksenii]|nr:Uncharacterised protein [Yersinia frederiksenii]